MIEMLAAMTVSSTLLVLATGMIHQTMRLQSQGRQQATRQQTALRLARQFRHDVQRSRQASLQRNGAALILEPSQPGEAAVTYSTEDGQVLRDQLHADRRHQRAPFRFAPSDQAHFELLSDPRRAVLIVTHPVDRVGGKGRLELHVEAVLGRHRVGSSTSQQPPLESPTVRTSPDKKYPAQETPS